VLRRRRQFGAPGSTEEELLLDYGMHRRRLFPLLARTYALHFAQERLVADLHRVFTSDASGEEVTERERRALESRAAGTKALGTWHASRAIQACREACGGAGYLSVNRFAALRADTDVFTTFEGDNTVLLQLVAKGLLTDYRDEFGDLDQIGMVRFVASMAVETVLERTSARALLDRLRDVVPSGEDDPRAGLLDPAYHRQLLVWREEHMLAGVARRLKRGIDRGGDPVAVFSECQDHVIGCARAHVERLVLEAFQDKVAGADSNQEPLRLLCNLFALSCIEEDRAWFLEHGRLSNARAKAVTATVNELCGQVRPVCRELVDAFAVPPELMGTELLQAEAD
jgi:acyl-CoA oxidase